jgi:superfamily II DNA or RNA helicase
MARLEDLTKGAIVAGVLPSTSVTVVDATWHGEVLELVYRDAAGAHGSVLLYRENEPGLEIVTTGRPWSFDGDGDIFRLALEAKRIQLAHLFDPRVAVHASDVEPLPHQISAVYEEMLPRQPLRFLLADDPGAGKTIMTGLLIRELRIRGDLQRCLIVCPGSLVEQWQDELARRFDLPFEILTADKIEASRSGNWFAENPLAIARLDKLSRDDETRDKALMIDWDLVVCDEAHKLAASVFSSEVKKTKRYQLGEALSAHTRNFLLLTATPHNGKEADFQLFMALLDGDRFEGVYRQGVHQADASDLMRRLVKEELLTFEGKPLFPERIAQTVPYTLTDDEALLYKEVTEYVRQEFNRADALGNDGRKGTVGFALTVLQRRLASSPEAIYQSLFRRRERLEKRLKEERAIKRGGEVALSPGGMRLLRDDEIEDLDDAPGDEAEATEDTLVDQASAAGTIAELEAEIVVLAHLVELARRVRASGQDRKWQQFSSLLHDEVIGRMEGGGRRKLVVFTEHRDTLAYLHRKTAGLLGDQAVVLIHGGMGREERRTAQERFTQDPDTALLIATDAAGEGINLQRAHLMVNYDLPWNPNRLEQRFGRIHRIGQTEVCHLWNLVANETREGDVYQSLLKKLDEERAALGGRVFDVLGKLTFQDKPLRELLIDAIRYGDDPVVRARIDQVVAQALDREHLQALLEERALVHDAMDLSRVRKIGDEMARADARRLQPNFISTFFQAAFTHLGGNMVRREPGRWEVRSVPGSLIQRSRSIGLGAALLKRYERITFERRLVAAPGKPGAALVAPGHALLDATVAVILEHHLPEIRRGTVLVAEADPGTELTALAVLEHAIQDGRPTATGGRRVVSKRLEFVSLHEDGTVSRGGPAPYLDFRSPTAEEAELLREPLARAAWLGEGLERRATTYAIAQLSPDHLAEVRDRVEPQVEKTRQQVMTRLKTEIGYWDTRYVELQLREEAGKKVAHPSATALQRRQELEGRLQVRLAELEEERHLQAQSPTVVGGALVVPAGLLAQLRGEPPTPEQQRTREIELAAMAAVAAHEQALGHTPRDVSADNCGYDIESRGADGRLRFIEVKGRARGADTVTVTRNEILTALNRPDDFWLAIVEVDDAGRAAPPRYARAPFTNAPEYAEQSRNLVIARLFDLEPAR